MLQITGKHHQTGEVVTVSVDGGRITRVEAGAQPGAIGGSDVWLSPGFFDLQLNGYGGYDFNTGAWADPGEVSDELPPLFEKVAASGTALLCPTITTNSEEAMCGALRRLAIALDRDPKLAAAVPAIHVEGPYLSPEDGPRGAHPLEHIRHPNWEEFQRLNEAAGGRIRLFTLAPEVEGALALIERLSAAGIVVAIGHTAAEPETIRDAFHAGARLSTHLGNGAHGQIRRHPNYVWEQLAHDGLYASVIADGHHLPASVVKCFARVKGPDRIALISDAVSLGGMAPRVYGHGTREVLPSGKIVVPGTPYLAGAGHLLDTCVANALRFTDLTLAEVTRCASTIPARILGLEDRKGHLRAGADADLTLFRVREEGPLEIVATVRAGAVAYRAA